MSNAVTVSGIQNLKTIMAEAKKSAAVATSKAAKKRAYRSAMIASKAALIQAVRSGDVRTTGLALRGSNSGTYGALYLADYDAAIKVKRAKVKPVVTAKA